jgi:hypothetical protein
VTADAGTDGSTSPGAPATVSVTRTQVVGDGGTGTARVVMDFDGPLPGRNVRHVDDITSVATGDVIISTTQQAASVHVCGAVHSFHHRRRGRWIC